MNDGKELNIDEKSTLEFIFKSQGIINMWDKNFVSLRHKLLPDLSDKDFAAQCVQFKEAHEPTDRILVDMYAINEQLSHLQDFLMMYFYNMENYYSDISGVALENSLRTVTFEKKSLLQLVNSVTKSGITYEESANNSFISNFDVTTTHAIDALKDAQAELQDLTSRQVMRFQKNPNLKYEDNTKCPMFHDFDNWVDKYIYGPAFNDLIPSVCEIGTTMVNIKKYEKDVVPDWADSYKNMAAWGYTLDDMLMIKDQYAEDVLDSGKFDHLYLLWPDGNPERTEQVSKKNLGWVNEVAVLSGEAKLGIWLDDEECNLRDQLIQHASDEKDMNVAEHEQQEDR